MNSATQAFLGHEAAYHMPVLFFSISLCYDYYVLLDSTILYHTVLLDSTIPPYYTIPNPACLSLSAPRL